MTSSPVNGNDMDSPNHVVTLLEELETEVMMNAHPTPHIDRMEAEATDEAGNKRRGIGEPLPRR